MREILKCHLKGKGRKVKEKLQKKILKFYLRGKVLKGEQKAKKQG